jgi:hypothetical protein
MQCGHIIEALINLHSVPSYLFSHVRHWNNTFRDFRRLTWSLVTQHQNNEQDDPTNILFRGPINQYFVLPSLYVYNTLWETTFDDF